MVTAVRDMLHEELGREIARVRVWDSATERLREADVRPHEGPDDSLCRLCLPDGRTFTVTWAQVGCAARYGSSLFV